MKVIGGYVFARIGM